MSLSDHDEVHETTLAEANFKHRFSGIPSSTPIIIGIYGISGSGKTHLLHQLRKTLGEEQFTFYEGSEVINQLVPGGLEAFKAMTDHQKLQHRNHVIEYIGKAHANCHKAAIVTGHYMFWPELDGAGQVVCSKSDLTTYSHILYLDTPSELVAQYRLDDTKRARELTSVEHLRKWQEKEKHELRQSCYDHKILFTLVLPSNETTGRVIRLIQCFANRFEDSNTELLHHQLYEQTDAKELKAMSDVLLMDADRTLTDEDTGKLFWKYAYDHKLFDQIEDPLKQLFGSPLGYSDEAFRQAALLYAESFDDLTFDTICTQVAEKTRIHPQFVSFLQVISGYETVGIVIATCGLRHIWTKILEQENLTGRVILIGSGRGLEEGVVTPNAKANLATYMSCARSRQVIAMGDSVLDLGMLSNADEAIVVVGSEVTRSKTMDQALADAIECQALTAKQVLIPCTVAPRLDRDRLPVINLNGRDILDLLKATSSGTAQNFQCIHATTKNAALLLSTKTRDARNYGSVLRNVHEDIGWYLAVEYCMEIIGVEKHPIPHVQGPTVVGHRLYYQKQTLIVALMRGGEPMAFGVSKAFPEAMFRHAKFPRDLQKDHLENCVTVILVDSVVNTGKSIIEFCQHINSLHATVRIVIVTGVAQSESIDKIRHESLAWKYNPISLVALRISDNKYTGRGGTDTGNRLFNTTGFV